MQIVLMYAQTDDVNVFLFLFGETKYFHLGGSKVLFFLNIYKCVEE